MKNRCLWLIVLLLLQVLAVRSVSFDQQLSPQQGLEAISNIPLHFDDWHGTDHPLDPQVYDILETRSILHRSYENSVGQRVFLSIVYYSETKVDFHAPEACLGGQGVKTIKSSDSVLIEETKTMLTVSKLVQQNEYGKNDLVYYFFKAGPFMGRSYIRLRLNLVMNKFKNESKSGSLIRVSTAMQNELDDQQESALLKEFINQINPYIVGYL